MAHEPDWQATADRLKKMPGIKLVTFEVGAPLSDDDREVVKVLGARPLPKPVEAALAASNGVKLVWNGEVAGKPAQGSVNILPFLQAAVRGGADEKSAPLEGVLWDEEFPEAAKKKLQAMTIFEALAGRSAHLAYRSDDPEAKLHLVDEDEIAPLVPPFAEVVGLLARHVGADGLREILTHEDWKKRLADDAQMQALAGS
ncbi:hypothetical protein FHS95_000442 [Sphingomonas naasensis]|uniref:Uncharacterized protein n=1 Tax=Sphingomonas naasensis TaxID=1344951 RepID=A0A4S1WWQ0_9SPHN|nr:hypothetical protein [Sphingomonas naasensis]NIJ18773.1 hypothetical protein [Sphingomonas naasensis]TGX46006.1 hypothetical protein E5A74_02190 [Sphingomonas naasensis]